MKDFLQSSSEINFSKTILCNGIALCSDAQKHVLCKVVSKNIHNCLPCKCNMYSLPNIVQVVKSSRMRWAGHVARMGEERGVHRVLVGKPEGKRPLR